VADEGVFITGDKAVARSPSAKIQRGIAVFAISAIVEVQQIKVVRVPVLIGLLFGKAQERAEESR
jgi:hypothetical protein